MWFPLLLSFSLFPPCSSSVSLSFLSAFPEFIMHIYTPSPHPTPSPCCAHCLVPFHQKSCPLFQNIDGVVFLNYLFIYIFYIFIQFLRVPFHLHLLQNIVYIPHVVLYKYILEPFLTLNSLLNFLNEKF